MGVDRFRLGMQGFELCFLYCAVEFADQLKDSFGLFGVFLV